MRFGGKITQEDLVDIRRIVRSKMYWPKLILANWYGVLLLCAVVWGTIEGLLGNTHLNWAAVIVIWGVISTIFGWSFYRVHKSERRDFQQLNAGLPDWLAIEEQGIKSDGPNGASGFRPWSNFKGWREGRRVILLDLTNDGFVILPVAEQSETERNSTRRLLGSHIQVHTGEATLTR